MSDNFGTNQNRVLDVENRSLDNVVFQNRIPSLTSELNLINQISNDKTQKVLKSIYPSGWLKVDSIDQLSDSITENNARSGQVLCSSSYGSNTFKLVSTDMSNVAVVNGWPILIQKTIPEKPYDLVKDLISIKLPPNSGSYRYDVVFLEVWRKLVGESDLIYPYGNVQAPSSLDKQIVWDSVGIETTKRVQLQYRIRDKIDSAYTSNIDFNQYPEGLGSPQIKAIGGNPDGTFTTYSFTNAGVKDPGLYIAGTGSDADKIALNTVDGFVYAIPMFVVYRRANYDYSTNKIHGAKVTSNNTRSDRPDGKKLDLIYSSDIVDLRHTSLSSNGNLDSILKRSFRKLISGNLRTKIGKVFGNSGSRYTASGGSEILKIEQLNGSGSLPNIGSGSDSGANSVKRTQFSFASGYSKRNVVQLDISPESTWHTNEINLNTYFIQSFGTITDVTGIFYVDSSSSPATSDGIDISWDYADPDPSDKVYVKYKVTTIYKLVQNNSYSNTDQIIEKDANSITLASGRKLDVSGTVSYKSKDLEGNTEAITSVDLSVNDYIEYEDDPYIEFTNQAPISGKSTTDVKVFVEFDFYYNESNNGFKDLPKKILEVNKDYRVPIPVRNSDVLLRYDNDLNLLEFNNGLASDGTSENDYVHYAGGNETENYNFGVDLVIHRTIDVRSGGFSIECENGKLNGYPVLGVKTVQYKELGTWSDPISFSLQMERTTSSIFYIKSTGLSDGSYEFKITLSVGSNEFGSFKFFETSHQARGVVDTYELIEIDASAVSNGSADWVVESLDKPFIAFSSKTFNSNPVESQAYVYVRRSDHSTYYAAESFELYHPSATSDPANSFLPVEPDQYGEDYLPNRLKIKLRNPLEILDVKVVALVRSYVESGEGAYNFVLNVSPYQGRLELSTDKFYGKIVAQGPALITTSGSGKISNYTYSKGSVTVINNSRTVNGKNTDWVQDSGATFNVLSGDYISINGSNYYRIEEVQPTHLTLSEKFYSPSGAPSANSSYQIVRLDVPKSYLANVIDRMPTLKLENDYQAKSTLMDVGNIETDIYETNPRLVGQSPLDAATNDFTVGDSSSIRLRGFSNFKLTLSNSSEFFGKKTTSIEYEKMKAMIDDSSLEWSTEEGVKKVYQSYILNAAVSSNPSDLSGKLYMVVIANETGLKSGATILNGNSEIDVVDLFELEGRPIIKTV